MAAMEALEMRRRVSSLFFAALLGAAIFLSGYYIGERHQPEASRVVGLLHVETPGASSTGVGVGSSAEQQLTTCVDQKGAEVPCLLGRDNVTVKNAEEVADFEQFWKAWNLVSEQYVPVKGRKASNQEKVWGAISGLANSLEDPYTVFLPPEEKTTFTQDVQGNFGGVGMQIGMKDGLVTVIAPLKGSPAERAGIKAGDKVLRIDSATTTEMTLDKALYLIRGEIGKPVRLMLLHLDEDTPVEISVVREVIQVPTIDTKNHGDVFVIQLYGFPATGGDLFRGALREFVQSGSHKLVLDLRGNPGGYLEVAVDMASWFLPAGKTVVSSEEKNGGQVYRSKGYNVFGDSFKMVVLVDQGSASAAEILAGALSQNGVATLVGMKTFGKGSVQELFPITEDTSLKLTIARWITPNGTNLSAGGLDPDIIVEITRADIEAGKDPQLDRAIEVARGLGK